MSQTAVIPEWTLGWRLQRALAEAGVSVQEMADELGVSRGTVSRWCNDHGEPSRGYLKLWALRTNVSHDWLVTGDSVPSPVGGTLQLTRSKAIPTGIEHQPPSTAEIKAIRKRIPLQAPVQEPPMIDNDELQVGRLVRTGASAPEGGLGASQLPLDSKLAPVTCSQAIRRRIPLRAPRFEPLLRLVAA